MLCSLIRFTISGRTQYFTRGPMSSPLTTIVTSPPFLQISRAASTAELLAPTTITLFDGGSVGQEITIIFGDVNTTIADGASLHLSGGVNFVSSADDTLKLIYDGSSWYEITRSVN